MSANTADVVVVGAGIVGAACARAFAEEGMGVIVVEADQIGGGATAAGMGHVVIMDDSQAQFALTSYSQQLWQEISDELPEDCQYQRTGTLWIAADEEEMEAVRRKKGYYQARHVAAEVLDAAALAEAEPNLRPRLAGGLRVPGDSAVYPPCVARWLLVRADERGAVVRVGTAVTEISDRGVRLADGSFLSAGLTVNAAGTWAGDFAPGLDLRPRKGHIVITDRYPGFARHQLIELGYLKSAQAITADSVAFNVQPRVTGQLLIGSSRQAEDKTSEVDADTLGRMVRRAVAYMPRLAGLSAIRAWTGFRAATRDKLPLVGPAPGHERIYLATGHEGLGITMALGTAALVVDEVVGRRSPIPREPYLPSRFAEGAGDA